MKERCLEFGNRTEKEGPKHCSSVARTVPAPNRDLKRSDLLQKNLQNFTNNFGTQLPTHCFRRNSNRTPDRPETGSRTDKFWALGEMNSNLPIIVHVNSNRDFFQSRSRSRSRIWGREEIRRKLGPKL